jgi:hypothetical protein
MLHVLDNMMPHTFVEFGAAINSNGRSASSVDSSYKVNSRLLHQLDSNKVEREEQHLRTTILVLPEGKSFTSQIGKYLAHRKTDPHL